MKRHSFFWVTILLFYSIISNIECKNYKGAEYHTLAAYTYGRFDVRFKPANREGVVSSFFTFHQGNSNEWNEIDIEIVGRYKNIVQFNAITPGHQLHLRSNYVQFDPYIDFHEYGFEWTPDYVAWFIDGVEVYRQTGQHVSTLNKPQNIFMNIWIPEWTNWAGYFNDAYLPAASVYDWVQYSSYTPGNGNYGTGNNFSIQWKDNFDSLDTTRWVKSTHTFSGNLVDFLPENVITNDGILKLLLTDKENTGDVDFNPPSAIWAKANYDSSIVIRFSEEIDKTNAENISNYILSDTEILSAILSQDKKQVKLQTSGFNPFSPASLVVKNITEDKPNPNVKPLQALSVNAVNPLEFPVKINVGGSSYKDYLPDQEWGPAVEYGYYSGTVRNYSGINILGTSDDELFLHERSGLVSYKIHVPNGIYKLSLLFAEKDNNLAGERTFNVVAENNYIIENLDVFTQIGRNAVLKIENNVQVTDGVLDLYFEEITDSAFVDAIILEKIPTDIKSKKDKLQNKFGIYQNYPNPFNPSTTITYTIPTSETLHAMSQQLVQLKIYDILGREVATLVKKKQLPGTYEVTFDASELPSGVYIYKLQSQTGSLVKKMMLVK